MEILQPFKSATDEFFHLIASFPQDKLNDVPFEGSWTAAQVGEHIFRSDNSVLQSVGASGKETLRPPDEKVEEIKNQFLNFDLKMQSPEGIVPPANHYEKDDVMNSLQGSRARLRDVIETSDLTQTCVHPALGELTRLEFLNFVVYHTQRHSHQLKNIYQKLNDRY